MVRFFSMFSLVLIVLIGCSEPVPRNLESLVAQGDLLLDRETMQPYTGPVFEFASGDTTRVGFVGRMRNGKLHGRIERYGRDGELTDVGHYVDGALHGPIESFYSNGQLSLRGTMVDGEGSGSWETFHEDGTPMDAGSYLNSEPEGPWRYYDEGGTVIRQGSYSSGEECGRWIEDGETKDYPPCPGSSGN